MSQYNGVNSGLMHNSRSLSGPQDDADCYRWTKSADDISLEYFMQCKHGENELINLHF